MKAIKLFVGISAIVSFVACSTDEPKQNTKAQETATENKILEPFRFHKAIEVKPGLTFDIVSWGRGSELVGGYLILRSDSTRSQYKSVSDQLEGRLVDAWNMDMDSDGNPEVFIQSTAEDERSYLNLYVYEFNDSGSSQKLRFPELTSSTKKLYHGKDSIFIKEGKLYRQFPVFDEKDTAAVSPTGKKLLEYTLRGNSFSVDEIEDEEKAKTR
jgi:hypothetical protein